jgi:regulator of nonsense transcripts 1
MQLYTLQDLEKEAAGDDDPEPVPVHFDDAFHFQNIFGPLVKIEADEDRLASQQVKEQNVHLRWDQVGVITFARL